jgi:hypothetical protein
MAAILATQEAEIRKQKRDPISKIPNTHTHTHTHTRTCTQWTGGVAQVVEYLLSKSEIKSSNPSTTKEIQI